MTKFFQKIFRFLYRPIRYLVKLLTEMDYSQKNLSDQESIVLFKKAANTNIKILHFLGNQATQQAMPALTSAIQANAHLKEVYLGENNIGDEGAKILADCLNENHTLKLLDINSNNITNNGAASIAKSLEKNSTLTELDLSNNDIGDEGFQNILNALQKNKQSALISLSTFHNLAQNEILLQKIDEQCNTNKNAFR